MKEIFLSNLRTALFGSIPTEEIAVVMDIVALQLGKYDLKVKPTEIEQDVITTHDTLSTDLKTFNQIDEGKHWQDVRERAAIAAMQGILCAPIVEGVDPNPSQKHVAELAVMMADALIDELKKK